MAPKDQHADDVSTGKVLSAEFDKTMADLRAYRRLSLAAGLRGEKVPGYRAECHRRVERCETLLRQLKRERAAALERLTLR